MPRCCHRLPAFSILFLAQEALMTAAATLLGRESSDTSSRLQARGTDVLSDKYFIPAIATIGALVLFSLVCLYFLGCCCNSRKMDAMVVSSNRNSTTHPPPATSLNADGSDKYSNVTPTKTPPHGLPPAQVSNHAYPPLPPARPQQVDAQQWHNGNQWPSMAPPVSHGFQPISHTSNPPSVMTVHHINSTAASYPQREYERSQVLRPPNIQPDTRRMSSMSSVTSSTQIGSGAGEQAPYVYSPHQGNTLSYVSSTSPSVGAPVWDPSIVQRMPDNGNSPPAVAPEQQVYYPQMPAQSGPPAYPDDSKARPVDPRKS